MIGIGPGSAEYLLPKALQEGELCKVLIGSARALQLFNTEGKETKIIDKNLMDVLSLLRRTDRLKWSGSWLVAIQVFIVC